MSMMKGINKRISLVAMIIFTGTVMPVQAEKTTVALSQEQDGGTAGRACMYIHQGRAEYVMVQPDAVCPASVTLDVTTSST